MKLPTLRAATPADVGSVLALLRIANGCGEFPFGKFSEAACEVTINNCLARGCVLLSLSHGNPVGFAMAFVSGVWWTDAQALQHIATFVHPEHRRAPHARGLLRAVRSVATYMQMPMVSDVLSTKRTAGKVRLFQQEFGEPVGATFLVGI